MSHDAALREALTRYLTEAPAGGILADRLQRTARATLSLYDQALTSAGSDTRWADHNLAIILSSGLEDPALRGAAKTLFLGARRRLSAALAAEPDDLACAVALALGVLHGPNDPRLAADIAMVAEALAKPHAGPKLVRAALSMALAAAASETPEVKSAAQQAMGPIQEAAKRLVTRLPNHPDVPLDRARLALHRSHTEEGEARQAALDEAHALLGDHEARFGPTTEARTIRAELLAWRARTGGAGADIRADALTLFEAQAAEGSLEPHQAKRLVDAIDRAKALDPETARQLTSQIEAIAGEDSGPWRKVMTTLLHRTGEDTSLLRLWERSLLEDPKDEESAGGLAERLLQNLRAGVAAPFQSDVLERVLGALPHRLLAKWRPDDLDRVTAHVSEVFGVAHAAGFIRDRVLNNRELRKKDGTWTRALDLFEQLGDDAALLEVAKHAVKHSRHGRARLLVAGRLFSGNPTLGDLQEAAEALRPLLSSRGKEGAQAHKLHQEIIAHPGFRQARLHALEAFEERIGVGTDALFQLRVIHTTPTYVLVEAHEHKAPDVYEHRHLRTLIRAQDMPKGVHPMHLRKGDLFKGTLRGQAGDKGKESLRVYWIAHPKKLSLAMGSEAITARLDKEERAFGIGSGKALPLKVLYDNKRKTLVAKIVAKADGKGGEFTERPSMALEQLPTEMSETSLGKGKRIYAVVERDSARDEGARRAYKVVGEASASAPAQGTKAPKAKSNATKSKPASVKGPQAAEEASTTKTDTAPAAEAPEESAAAPSVEAPKAVDAAPEESASAPAESETEAPQAEGA